MPMTRYAAGTLLSSPAFAKVRRRNRYNKSSQITATRRSPGSGGQGAGRVAAVPTCRDQPRCRHISGMGRAGARISCLRPEFGWKRLRTLDLVNWPHPVIGGEADSLPPIEKYHLS
jgi:hypothetical protein